MIDWDADIDLDCPTCGCCTEDACRNESVSCILSGCPCYSDQPSNAGEYL